MKKRITILFLLAIYSLFSQNNNKLTLFSKVLNEERSCLIHLPEGYNNPSNKDKRYPILILLDGDVFFKEAIGVVDFMSSDRNRNHLMPKTILIAIENVDRGRDFTVTKIKIKRPNNMGGGKKFLKFIEHELIPFIDKKYRTEPDRTLVGHSLGGLLTLNAYMDENSIFDFYISIDPSIWWSEKVMEDRVEAVSSKSFKKKLYIATANQGEANYKKNKKRHDDFFRMLKNKSKEKQNLAIEYFKDEHHRSVPLIALYHGLKFLNVE
ncbi:alpha/beta hydrolase [Tenacibaculum amylolyticum]|uniref:alpha/beta hydrolase n=1 Tax=Tenacibaculum amylolyticum TaxID=104269 RepID=UPI00389367BC